ncbi:MAG: NAD(P)H-hydrate epimerase [Planctomycetes bacterium]|nr:NAD(P)H-hydrate epimerase [Planctomycetota bacterium]
MGRDEDTPRTVTREEMREADRRAIEEYGIPGVVLMENAGRAVAREAIDMLEDALVPRVAILCGKGNNGGDGFVAARHLHNQGVAVDVYLFAVTADVAFSHDPWTHLNTLIKMGFEIKEVTTVPDARGIFMEIDDADLIIDGLLGTGLEGEIREPYRTAVEDMNNSGVPVLSIDIPSGLDCNNGHVLGVAVRAARTVTFVLPKKGFMLAEGPGHVGEVVVADIGMPRDLVRSL